MATRAPSDTEDAALCLTGAGWLSHVPTDFAATIIALAQWRRFAPGDTIMTAGDKTGDLIGLATGTVALTSALGPADSPVAHIVTGPFWFGYAPIIAPGTRILSCLARSPVLLAQVRQSTLGALLTANPHYWQWMATLAHENAHVAANIATDLMIRSSRRRCAATLLRIAGCRFAATRPPAIAWTNQEELGGIANLARSTLNLILGDLETEGLITRGYNQIILHNTPALRALVDG